MMHIFLIVILWIGIVIAAAYCVGGLWWTIHSIRDHRRRTVTITHWWGWIISFLIWPLAMISVAAISGMLM